MKYPCLINVCLESSNVCPFAHLPVCPFALVKFIFAREYGIPCKSLLNTQANSPILQNGTPGLKLLKNVQHKTQCPAITGQ